MAGAGSRFSTAGYEVPKPLLPIGNWRMFEIVIANLWHQDVTELSLVTQRGLLRDDAMNRLKKLGVDLNLFEVDDLTDGPARSVSIALQDAKSSAAVIVANSDQFIDADLSDFHARIRGQARSGHILTMEDSDPKWSYVRLGSNGLVEMVREKEVISTMATVGIYSFPSARVFRDSFRAMERAGDRTNGELYVAPIYNYFPTKLRVTAKHLGPVGNLMHGLGIPTDYEKFLGSEPYFRAIGRAAEVFE